LPKKKGDRRLPEQSRLQWARAYDWLNLRLDVVAGPSLQSTSCRRADRNQSADVYLNDACLVVQMSCESAFPLQQ
jgi:hypothetical protein